MVASESAGEWVMKKVARIKGIVSKPLQQRYLTANESERLAMRELIERESQWMVEKMARKGYQLEGTVAEVYGIFTRGAARGTLKVPAHQEA